MRYWASPHRPGIPLLFLHGYSSLMEHWCRVLPRIARLHPCYTLDLYGLGYSAPLQGLPDKQVWVDQTADFIQRVLPAPPIVVANSLGGVAAALLARDYPQLVRGLVLVDSTGLPNAPSYYPLVEHAFYRIIKLPLVGETLAWAMGRPFGVLQFLMIFYHRRERITTDLVAALSGPLRQPGAAMFRLGLLRAMERFSIDIRPGEVRAPTLIVWGERDIVLPPVFAEQFRQQLFPHADIAIIPDSGHCPFDETPEEFCDILLMWVEKMLQNQSKSISETPLPRKDVGANSLKQSSIGRIRPSRQ